MPDIILTNGFAVKTDDVDFEMFISLVWSCNNYGYAYRCGGGKTILLHREIAASMGLNLDYEIEHKDQDTLNCYRSNLRVATHAQNLMNVVKYKGTTSQYKGVSYDWRSRKYRARIKIGKSHIWLGQFDTEVEAARRYDNAARRHFKEFACLNFPGD